MQNKDRPFYLKPILLLTLFLSASAVLFYIPYRVVHDASLSSLNTRQLILARNAARGIEDFLQHHEQLLLYLARQEGVVALDTAGKLVIDELYRLHQDEVSALVRVDADGQLSYRVPAGPDSRIEEIVLRENRRLADSSAPLVSEVFTDARGDLAAAMTVPVSDGARRAGSLSLLLPLRVISAKYLAGVAVGNGGYAWMLSGSGVELYCPVPGHTGRTIFETSSRFPTVIAMAEKMMQGKEGHAVYEYDQIKDEETQAIRKLAVYTPVFLGGATWSVAVATPEREALEELNDFGKWWLAVFGIIVIGFFLYLTLIFLATSEGKKREEAEQKLLGRERLLSRFIDNAHIPIAIVHIEGKIELLNEKFQQLYGYTLHDIPTMKQWFSRAYPDEKLRKEISLAWRRKLEEARSSGDAPTFNERTITCKDGSRRDVVYSYTLVDDRVIITFNDTTEQNRLKRAEEALLSKQFKAKKMEAIGLMAGGVAHDLNNILSGIVNYPELLLLQLPAESELREPLQAIQEAGLRAAAVVADLLTIARGVAGTRETRDLNILLREYLDSPECRKLKLLHPDVVQAIDLAPEPLNISCSAVHIKKCIMNLVTNAAEAIKGEGRIVVATRRRHLDESAALELNLAPGEYAVISVSDTGEGISPEDLEHIFEPFYTKKVMGKSGTGLGLSVVWNSVQDHRGGIKVDSSGQGTTFALFFPVTGEALAETRGKTALDELRGDGEQILVVDDEPQQRDIATRMLTALGYRVQAVSSGEEAVEFLTTRRAELVLLDMLMGSGMNGRETYERIIRLHPGQKAVITSGYSKNEEVLKATELGAGGFVRKPYTMEALGRAVQRELSAGAANRIG